MPKRGPKPAPAALKLAKGTRESRINPDEPSGPKGLPEAPSGLDGDAREEWDRMVALLGPLGTLTPADGPALASYCELWAVSRQCLDEIKAGGVTAYTDKGALKGNPVVPLLISAIGQMNRILIEFGMTPSARTRLSVPQAPEKDPLDSFLSKSC